MCGMRGALTTVTMLPPYIIEQLRERERERKEDAARPRPLLELPMGPPPGLEPERTPQEERGVTIIDVF